MTTAELSPEEMEQLRIQVEHLRELEAQRQAVANPPRLQPAPAPDVVNAIGGQRPQAEPIQSPLSSQLSPPSPPPPQPVSTTTRQPMVQPIQSPLPGLADENSIRQALVRGRPNQPTPLVDSVRSTLARKAPAKGLPASLPAPSIETSQDRIPPDIQRVQNYPQQPQALPPQMPPPVNTDPPQLRPQMTAQDVQNRVSPALSPPAVSPPPSTTPDETMLQDRLRQLMSPPQQPTTALGRGGQMLQYFARYGAMDPAHAQALEIERQKGLAGVRQQQTTDVLARLKELTGQKNIESEMSHRQALERQAGETERLKAMTPQIHPVGPGQKLIGVVPGGQPQTLAEGGPKELTGGLTKTTIEYQGQPVDALEDLREDSPNKGKIFIQTATGLKDITGQQKHYTAPKDTSASDANRFQNSYKDHNDLIAKIETKGDDFAGRYSRLRANLALGTPQSDAIVVPELLTVEAGGAGSGLRLNEAEIQRTAGGRSNWESAKAWLQKWNTDPAHAGSLTTSQRQQMGQMLDIIGAKIQKRDQALTEGRHGLVTATTEIGHRQAFEKMQNDLRMIESGPQAQPAGNRPPLSSFEVK